MAPKYGGSFLGLPEKKGLKERPYLKPRNDEIRALYKKGTSPKEIAFRFSMTIWAIYKAIERRVGERRKAPRGKDRRGYGS
jgi:hypothetical protein